MPRIELPPIDADSFEARLEEAIPKTPSGKSISAWHTFSTGVKSMRTQLQDGHNAQDVQLTDIKKDVDSLRQGTDSRLDAQANRITAVESHLSESKAWVEALKSRPF